MDIQKLNQNLNKLNKILFIILGIAAAAWIGVEVFSALDTNTLEKLKSN